MMSIKKSIHEWTNRFDKRAEMFAFHHPYLAYREVSAGKLLSRNLLVYGLGGLVAPFIFIKLIDMLLVLLGLA